MAFEYPVPTAPSLEVFESNHARNWGKKNGTLKRPSNCFFIFRKYFSLQPEVKSLRLSGVDVGDAATRLWGQIGKAAQAPWKALAEREKEIFSSLYPTYKYAPEKKSSAGQNERSAQSTVSAASGSFGTKKRHPKVCLFGDQLYFALNLHPLVFKPRRSR